MAGVGGTFGRIYGRIEKFDADQVVIALLGGQRIFVDRSTLATKPNNLCITNAILYFRTHHTITQHNNTRITKLTISDVGVDPRVNYAYEKNALSIPSMRMIRDKFDIDLFIGGTMATMLPIPSIPLLTLMRAGDLALHTISSLIALAPDFNSTLISKLPECEVLRDELDAGRKRLAAKIKDGTPIIIFVHGQQWFKYVSLHDLVNRSMAGFGDVRLGGGLYLYSARSHHQLIQPLLYQS